MAFVLFDLDDAHVGLREVHRRLRRGRAVGTGTSGRTAVRVVMEPALRVIQGAAPRRVI